jgi:hypothetical protein
MHLVAKLAQHNQVCKRADRPLAKKKRVRVVKRHQLVLPTNRTGQTDLEPSVSDVGTLEERLEEIKILQAVGANANIHQAFDRVHPGRQGRRPLVGIVHVDAVACRAAVSFGVHTVGVVVNLPQALSGRSGLWCARMPRRYDTTGEETTSRDEKS